MTILITLVTLSFFQVFKVQVLRRIFNHHNRCLSTKLPGSTDHLRALNLFLPQETKKKVWHDYSTLTNGWSDSYVFPQGWIIKNKYFLQKEEE